MKWVRGLSVVVFAWSLGLLAGCGLQTEKDEGSEKPVTQSPPVERVPKGPLVVFLGNSLTAGYGLQESESFPALVADSLEEAGKEVRIVNAGISGDTTAGGLARLDWLLAQNPSVVVVELGANDGLRGLSLDETERNLDQILSRTLATGARVLLVGMKIPPSYGPEYSARFESLFRTLADRYEVALMPFLLERVAAVSELNQADGIHPNAAGQRILAEDILPYLEEVLAGL